MTDSGGHSEGLLTAEAGGTRVVRVGSASELLDQDRWVVTTVGTHSILTFASRGEIRAVGNICPHAGARMDLAADLYPHTMEIACRFHNRLFSLGTGEETTREIRDPCDALPIYEVEVSGDDVLVTVPPDDPAQLAAEAASN